MNIPEWSFVVVGNKLFNQNNDDVEYICDDEDNITIEDILTITNPDITLTVEPIIRDDIIIQIDDEVIHEAIHEVIHEVIHEDKESFLYHMFRMISDFFINYEHIHTLFS